MNWAKGVTKVVFVDDLPGGTPASCRPSTGEVFVNRHFWNSLPKEHKFFVLLHEWGHIQARTRNEKTADQYAFEEYAKRGYSLKASVRVLCRLLRFDKAEDYQRIWTQYQRALAYDKAHNYKK